MSTIRSAAITAAQSASRALNLAPGTDIHRVIEAVESALSRRFVVIDPDDRDQVCRLALALADDDKSLGFLRTQDALRSLLVPPQEVYEHFTTNPPGTAPVKSLCGKVWYPDTASKVVGRCPECTAFVAKGWVA